MTGVTERHTTRQLAALGCVVVAILLIADATALVFAQGTPFGTPPAPASPSPHGIVGWIFAKQNEFYRQFSAMIRAARADGSAVWGLLGVSFLYGVFHAAGPGHGKAVISSYVVANDETWLRGIVLSFASALFQALVAIVFVGIAAVLLHATAPTMNSAAKVIEIFSYGLIILIGLRLIWVKGRGFITAARALGRVPAAAHDGDHGQAYHPPHVHGRPDHHHDNGHGHTCDHGHDHAHAGGHVHRHDSAEQGASACGHAHAPEPDQLAGPGGWQRGLSAIVAVGLRPCSGAIIVLIFALANGLFWAGVAATLMMGFGTALTVATIATMAVGARSWAGRFARHQAGYGSLTLRGVEVAAAFVVVAFGVLLLFGFMGNERLLGV